MLNDSPIRLQRYHALPKIMFSESNTSGSSTPSLIELNENLLKEYGIDSGWFKSKKGLMTLAGNDTELMNSPLAMAYSGHQFGHWVPILGDGRAHMLGQMKTYNDSLIDVQLKGSGRTNYSRGGDGRATLGSVLREYLISEAMAGLSIPTTRALAIIKTGDMVQRENIVSSAILVRTAASHIRVGTFQYASATQQVSVIKALADFVINQHFPEIEQHDDKYVALLNKVIEQQAELIAKWMLVGFIHGVMNTDNMSIVSETIDYGPCAFMDTFKSNRVFSSIDRYGRYAWDQQATIAVWNLNRLAETFLPLLDLKTKSAIVIVEEQLAKFTSKFNLFLQQGLIKKFGFHERTGKHLEFINDSLMMLSKQKIDFTLFFNYLTNVNKGDTEGLFLELFSDREKGIMWLNEWQKLKSDNPEIKLAMRQVNPVFIARNHQVEKAIRAAEDYGDYSLFKRFAKSLINPFEVSSDNEEFNFPPTPEEIITQTFCGT
ncbi:MAG: selenoprotein O and cysteine like protein [Legionellales bacterium]|nr:selenoprotein O and cysteine like protein [Legionellales bacterium]